MNNYIHDNRINADNYSLVMTLGEYYELVKDSLNDNEYQRKRVRNSGSFYSLLKKDLIKGCIMPPIVLALCEEISSDEDILSIIKQFKSRLKILDGLQRSYTIKEIVKDYTNSLLNEDNPLNNPIRVEVYVGIDKLGILYRMLTLNAGQTPMTTRHQIEIIYSDYKDSCDFDGINFMTETEGDTPHFLGDYKFRDVVEGFTSFLQKDYLTLERREILENARDLERIATFAADKHLFHNFVEVYHKLVCRIHNIDSLQRSVSEIENRCSLTASPFATSYVGIFNKSQALTGFGCAMAQLLDEKQICGLIDIHSRIDQIDASTVEEGFYAIIGILDWIRQNAKKIGNDQRKYFYLMFLSLLSNNSDTSFRFKESVEASFIEFKNSKNEQPLF